MTWEEVLSYEEQVRFLAGKWSRKTDPSLFEDAIQHTYIVMRENVDLNRVRESEKKFVLGAINNILYKFFRSPTTGSWKHRSLDALADVGFQIDEDGAPRWPSSDGEYKGDLLDTND